MGRAEQRHQHSPVPRGSLSLSAFISMDLMTTSGFLLKPQETEPLSKRMISQDRSYPLGLGTEEGHPNKPGPRVPAQS